MRTFKGPPEPIAPRTRTVSPDRLREEHRRAGINAGEPPWSIGLVLHSGSRYNENIRRWVHTCPACGYPAGEFLLSPWVCRNRIPSPTGPVPCSATVAEWDRPWVFTKREAMPWLEEKRGLF